jgi:hypothetical protein
MASAKLNCDTFLMASTSFATFQLFYEFPTPDQRLVFQYQAHRSQPFRWVSRPEELIGNSDAKHVWWFQTNGPLNDELRKQTERKDPDPRRQQPANDPIILVGRLSYKMPHPADQWPLADDAYITGKDDRSCWIHCFIEHFIVYEPYRHQHHGSTFFSEFERRAVLNALLTGIPEKYNCSRLLGVRFVLKALATLLPVMSTAQCHHFFELYDNVSTFYSQRNSSVPLDDLHPLLRNYTFGYWQFWEKNGFEPILLERYDDSEEEEDEDGDNGKTVWVLMSKHAKFDAATWTPPLIKTMPPRSPRRRKDPKSKRRKQNETADTTTVTSMDVDSAIA